MFTNFSENAHSLEEGARKRFTDVAGVAQAETDIYLYDPQQFYYSSNRKLYSFQTQSTLVALLIL